ncbi:cellulase family glycosylhydrolase [Gilvibacter sediminis]|uniref:cellulase family glycosylhydrolase n=1 Tax=Gilvibacter sediminis TaxID=379071 RepID=UPI002350BCFD|nr:cellulase family glycosylhydrolase [Gilvibacter sediminis]MDC7997301.1 cellulase family glycosylhydrolase [Gilvibacter sediminis]
MIRRVVLAVLLLLSLAVLGKVLQYFNEGADRSSLLADESAASGRITPFDFDLGSDYIGDPDRVVLQSIAKDYSLALNQLQAAFSLQDTTLIADQFTPQLRKKLNVLLSAGYDPNIEQQYIKHNLVFRFLSADRQIAAFTDKDALRISSQKLSDGDLEIVDSQQISQEVIMFLQDGFWRIAYLEQVAINPYQCQTETTLTADPNLRGINYYPKDFPWDTFNQELELDTIAKDFKFIREQGLNAVRLFVDFHDFGGGNPDPEHLSRLETILDLAQTADLKVVLTLFDFYGDYSLANWPAASNHIEVLTQKLGDHPAIHSWDLKNEPDLDYEGQGEKRVEAWLRFVADQLRSQKITQPITIGWSSAMAAYELTDLVDYVSFHHYTAPENLPEDLKNLKAKTDKSLVVQEFGMSTNRGLWAPLGNSQDDQLAYYETMLKTFESASVSFMCWTLYDFEEVPGKVSSWKPWIKNKQANFGLLDHSGVEKSALQALRTSLSR